MGIGSAEGGLRMFFLPILGKPASTQNVKQYLICMHMQDEASISAHFFPAVQTDYKITMAMDRPGLTSCVKEHCNNTRPSAPRKWHWRKAIQATPSLKDSQHDADHRYLDVIWYWNTYMYYCICIYTCNCINCINDSIAKSGYEYCERIGLVDNNTMFLCLERISSNLLR